MKKLSVRLAIDIMLNSAGFLVSRDMVRTFNIHKVAVSDLVYRFLALALKRHILLSRLKTTQTSIQILLVRTLDVSAQ